MKTAAWAAVGSLLMGTAVFAQGAAANDAADDLGRGSAISFVLDSGWTFHPATADHRVVGYLAVLPAERAEQAEFNIFWYERGEDGAYSASVWSGWDVRSAAHGLQGTYGPGVFTAYELRAGGQSTLEDGRFIPLTLEMSVVDPATAATEALRRRPGAADGPGHVGGNGSDSGDGCGTTTEFVLDRFARRVEMVLFGEARTPVSTIFGCCWPKTIPVEQIVSVVCGAVTPIAGGTCQYTSCTETYTVRTCQQRSDCTVGACTPPGPPATRPVTKGGCPSSGAGTCPPQPPVSCW